VLDAEPGDEVVLNPALDPVVEQAALEEQPAGAMSREGLQESAVRGAVWTVVHTFVAIPVAFLVNLLMARVLGAADYGRLAFLTALMEV
ncbi:hypothetical protein, partial [Pseudomonas sp. PNPG3]|uniref:hypothetical protein n=1 Tax=Pseudomonas sp. PNPG3 TaxID=2919497 RepID=UPI001FFCD779